MKKSIPRPQPAPLSYGVQETLCMCFTPASRVRCAIKRFLISIAPGGDVNPKCITEPPPRPFRTSVHRITDRQAEIMTSALCEVIFRAGRVTAENAADAAPALIKALVVQVSNLNEAIADANSGVTARVSSTSRGCRCQRVI